MGTPVELPLGALGTGNGTVFSAGPIDYQGIEFSGLPVGVELVGNKLVGTPERRGLWIATVTATGSAGTKTANLHGYVVGEYPVSANAPQITPGILRSPFLVNGRAPGPDPANELWVYEPGRTSPRGHLEASGSASNPEPSEGYGLPEEMVIGVLRSGMFASAESDGVCRIRLVPFLQPFVTGGIELADPNPSAECPGIMYSEDGSTILTHSTTPNPTGTPIHRFDFYRTADGSLIRSTTRTSSWASSPVLAHDGSAAVATFADNELQTDGGVTEVIGAGVNADRLFVLSDESGRRCRVGNSLGSIRNRTVAIGCRYPTGEARAGILNIDTAEIWLSQSGASEPSLSPNGEQLLVFGFPPTAQPTWPFTLYISVIDVGGDGAIKPLMPVPDGFSGLMFFTPP